MGSMVGGVLDCWWVVVGVGGGMVEWGVGGGVRRIGKSREI